MTFFKKPSLLLALAAGLPGAAVADTNPWAPKITLETGYLNPSDIQGEGGEVSDRYYDALLENQFAYLGYTYWSLDWHDIDQLPFGNGKDKPVKGLRGARIGGKFNHRINSKMLFLSSLGVSSKYEEQTDDSYSVNLRALVSYKLKNELSLLGGIVYNYHPVRSRLYPAFGLAYRARSRDGLSAVLGFPRAFIAYGFAEKWNVSTGASYRQFMAKLANDSPVEEKGYVELQTWKADVMLSYQATKNWRIDVFGQYSADYRFSFYNRHGSRQTQYQLDPSWGSGMKLAYQF